MEAIRAAAKSDVKKLAGAIAASLRANGSSVEVQIVGAGALNQAMKAIAVARGFVASEGRDLVCLASFTTVEMDGEDRTGMRLTVIPQAIPIGHVALMGQSNRNRERAEDNGRASQRRREERRESRSEEQG